MEDYIITAAAAAKSSASQAKVFFSTEINWLPYQTNGHTDYTVLKRREVTDIILSYI